ncbi:uncharacterized protein LOC130680539 [Manis pentadactyla]|uniref:uncharacterized protein LOC130680539 n=1 Tax=Manis pentadactyla TaxID=143292 RepID=UPI00255CCD1F|nr:uncharacterized protein LOC130680539 [Manis pentadactyla]
MVICSCGTQAAEQRQHSGLLAVGPTVLDAPCRVNKRISNTDTSPPSRTYASLKVKLLTNNTNITFALKTNIFAGMAQQKRSRSRWLSVAGRDVESATRSFPSTKESRRGAGFAPGSWALAQGFLGVASRHTVCVRCGVAAWDLGQRERPEAGGLYCPRRAESSVGSGSAATDARELRAAVEPGGGSGEGCSGAAGSGGARRWQRRRMLGSCGQRRSMAAAAAEPGGCRAQRRGKCKR